jgi:phenylacetate-CoA ligase
MRTEDLISNVNGCHWPAIYAPAVSRLLATLWQLDQSQWWSPEQLRDFQFAQLRALVDHAAVNCPFYRDAFAAVGYEAGEPITPDNWRQLPVLTRDQLQQQYEAIKAQPSPPHHGRVNETQTSGSTGQPVRVMSTDPTRLIWQAMTLREHFWHKRDHAGALCAIRPRSGPIMTEPIDTPSWGPPVATIRRTGAGRLVDVRLDPQRQLDLIMQCDPAYIITLPSTIEAITQLAIERNQRPANLRQISTYAERLRLEVRDVVRQAWGVSVADMYSAQEVGYIALQCPHHEHYHMASESVYMEVVREDGLPCAAGETGRVLLTSLHNFATPLIRYEIRDYAELGEPCDCGRGLPVIKRIVGRRRNLITLPDGTRYWPVLYASSWSDIAPIRQLQLVQKAPDHFLARIVIDRELTDDQRTRLVAALRESLGYPFTFDFQYESRLMRGLNGKFESIMTEV